MAEAAQKAAGHHLHADILEAIYKKAEKVVRIVCNRAVPHGHSDWTEAIDNIVHRFGGSIMLALLGYSALDHDHRCQLPVAVAIGISSRLSTSPLEEWRDKHRISLVGERVIHRRHLSCHGVGGIGHAPPNGHLFSMIHAARRFRLPPARGIQSRPSLKKVGSPWQTSTHDDNGIWMQCSWGSRYTHHQQSPRKTNRHHHQ